MSYGMWDTTQLRKLEADLGKVVGSAVPAVSKVTATSGEELAQAWKANARATSGTHAAKYPGAVTSSPKGGIGVIAVEVGPTDTAGNQGFLGRILEYGGLHSPPHMDGNRAADIIGPKYQVELAAMLTKLFGK